MHLLDEGLGLRYALQKFTHKPQADASARDTIGRLRFRSRTLGLVIRNDMDGVTIERALKPHMPVEMTKLNNIYNFNIYSVVCRKYVSNGCPPYIQGNVFGAAAVCGEVPSRITHANLVPIEGYFTYRHVRPSQLSLMVVVQLDVRAR